MRYAMNDSRYRKMRRTLFFFSAVVAALPGFAAAADPAPAVVRYADGIRLDGRLDEAAWRNAPACPLAPLPAADEWKGIREKHAMDRRVLEPGTVRFLRDAGRLYIGLECADSDLCCESTADQAPLFYQGDSVELFLHRKGATEYWEIYGDLNLHKTAYRFPGRGRLRMKSNERKAADVAVAAVCDGTLNRPDDRDNGWSMELAVPIDALTDGGRIPFDTAAGWTVCAVRLNYSRFLPIFELSSYPALPSGQQHLYEEYLPMKIESPMDVKNERN